MRKRQISLIRQLGTTDCGIACLAMIYRYYDCNISINDLKSKIEIGRSGISLADMKKITEDMGFKFTAYYDYLNEQNLRTSLPAIIVTKQNHYVVISDYKKSKYTIYNPEIGIEKVSFEKIKKNYLKILVLIRPCQEYKYNKKKSNNLKRNINLNLKIDKIKLFLSIILTLISQATVLASPIIVGKIVDDIEYGAIFDIKKYIFLMFVLITVFFCSNFLKRKLILLLQTDMYIATIEQMIEKIFKIDLTFFENHLSGDLESRFSSVGELYEFISVLLINVSIDVLTSIFCGIIMFIKSKIIFFSILSLAFIQIAIVTMYNKKARVKAKNYIADKNALEGKMIETLINIQQIRCMRIDGIMSENLKKDYQNLVTRIIERDITSSVLESIVGAFSILITLSLYIIGGVLVKRSSISLGTLVSFVALSTYFVRPFQSLSLIIPQLNILNETIIRLEELIGYNDSLNVGNIEIKEFNDIELRDVSFSYYGNKNKDLSNINIKINKGEKVAIVGHSGSGKTTLIKLLLNVFSKYRGEIILNGINIKEVKKSDVDSLFSIVTQVPLAISGSIRENIDITNSNLDDDIYKLLKVVELEDEVKKFPLNIYTNIGEGGQNISGGQKQRIAIARALFTNPEILILDEATSNLDSLTEKKVFDNLQAMSLTLVVITHRLNTIKDADKIFVMRNGSIVEEGTHNELADIENSYYNTILKSYQ